MGKPMGYVYNGSRAYPWPRPKMFRFWYRTYMRRIRGKWSCYMPWKGV